MRLATFPEIARKSVWSRLGATVAARRGTPIVPVLIPF
jgi:hypothetical protein